MEISDNGELVFSTGKRIYCNGNIVGLELGGAKPGFWTPIYQGYDGGIETPLDTPPNRFGDDLNLDECIELAEHMIAAWKDLRDMALKRKNQG